MYQFCKTALRTRQGPCTKFSQKVHSRISDTSAQDLTGSMTPSGRIPLWGNMHRGMEFYIESELQHSEWYAIAIISNVVLIFYPFIFWSGVWGLNHDYFCRCFSTPTGLVGTGTFSLINHLARWPIKSRGTSWVNSFRSNLTHFSHCSLADA